MNRLGVLFGRAVNNRMARLCASCFTLVLCLQCLSASSAPSILGHWEFYAMSLDGVRMPPRDPRLELRFSFEDSGEDTLYWTYDAGVSFCERRGHYLYKEGFLIDQITWVNPNNKDDCQSDVDMQLGRQATTQLDLLNDEIALHIPFGDKEILYLLRKIEP